MAHQGFALPSIGRMRVIATQPANEVTSGSGVPDGIGWAKAAGAPSPWGIIECPLWGREDANMGSARIERNASLAKAGERDHMTAVDRWTDDLVAPFGAPTFDPDPETIANSTACPNRGG